LRSALAFNRELWLDRQGERFVPYARVNNAICSFDAGNRFLDFYIGAAESIVRSVRPVTPLSVGTNFLTGLARVMPIPLIHHVGTFGPMLIRALATGDEATLCEYARFYGSPIRAANVCASLCGKPCQGLIVHADEFGTAIDRLLSRNAKLC
jgi:hypothetical protein